MKYILTQYDGKIIGDVPITIDETAKKEFMGLMGWDEYDWKRHTKLINSETQAVVSQQLSNKDFTAHSDSPKVCPKCAGWKKVPDTSPSKTGFMTCPNCKGTGKPS